jgi:hypothetical protein
MKLGIISCVIAATLALTLGYAATGHWPLATLIVAIGLLWSLGVWRRWIWTNPTGFIGLIFGAALGIGFEASTGWLLVGTVAALIAWDLDNFLSRLAQTDISAGGSDSPHQDHWRRLAIVSGLGLLLGWIATGFEISLTFGLAVLVGLLLAISLSWTFGLVRRNVPPSQSG